nr:MAG TPA: hypothetical protein [Caudoviricetes sp.]
MTRLMMAARQQPKPFRWLHRDGRGSHRTTQ